jgi:hypothetical protein
MPDTTVEEKSNSLRYQPIHVADRYFVTEFR